MSNNDIDPSIAALLDDTEPYDFKKNSLDFEKMILAKSEENEPKKKNTNSLVPDVDLSIKEFKATPANAATAGATSFNGSSV